MVLRKIYWTVTLILCAAALWSQAPSGYEGNKGLGMGTVGTTGEDAIGIDPTTYLRTWNFNDLPEDVRSSFYRETPREDGSLLREYWFTAVDREIEVAPGVVFPAWTYNGQVPGPTIRATEGDLVRIYFTNAGTRPHTMHFHGYHGSLPEDFVFLGDSFTYEFEALPFGVHLYHCHSTRLTQHIHKGLYGVYIVDPKGAGPWPTSWS